MGDTVVPIAAPAKGGSFVARHWRGDISLPKSYWLNGVLLFGLGINAILAIVFLIAVNLLLHNLGAAWGIGIVYIALNCGAWVWAVVGVWRSASKYQGPRVWSVLAKIAIVLGVVVTVGNVARTVSAIQYATQAAQQGNQVQVY